jgi:hypothetical protein
VLSGVPSVALAGIDRMYNEMKKLKDYVDKAKFIVALENQGFDNVETYKNELFIIVMNQYNNTTAQYGQ